MKSNNTFDITIEYRDIMAEQIVSAAKIANMVPGDMFLAGFHMMMELATRNPREFADAAKGFYNHLRSQEAN